MEPITLFLGILKSLGKEFLTWDSATRKEVLKKQYNISLSDEDHNMLEAAVTLKVTDIVWAEYPAFEKSAWALNGFVPRMDIMEVPPPHYIAYAVYIMKVINKKNTFSEEVKGYIASILNLNGFVLAPPYLQFVQPQLNKFVQDKDLLNKTKDRWDKVKSTKLESLDINYSNPVSAQIGKLATVALYIQRKEDILQKEL